MTHNELVLVVEDEPKIAKLHEDYLRQYGYRSHWLDSGREAVEWIRDNSPDLVILDLMLPGKDGQTICREVRAFSNLPIIMVTARVEEIDRLIGLELGADDYVCKPFSPREVIARVQAVLRRANFNATESGVYRGIAIDVNGFQARLNGTELDLTPVEFRMLKLFVNQPGRVFSREQLIAAVYTDGRVVSDRTVDTHVKNLRRKLSAITDNEDLIHSVYGVGYKLD